MNSMEYETKNMEQGTQRGFTWLKHDSDKGNRVMYIIFPGEDVPETINPYNRLFGSGYGFFPFDESVKREENTLISATGMKNFDAEKWFDEQVKPPANCKIKINISTHNERVSFTAKTIRNNRIETVEKTIVTNIDPVTQLQKLYNYFAKNCPYSNDIEDLDYAISTIAQSAINACKVEGIRKFENWIELVRKSDQDGSYCSREVLIDSSIIDSNQIESMRFFLRNNVKQVFVELKIKDEHFYKEDEIGATSVINFIPAETIVKGAKGKSLASILGIPGAEESIIKKASIKSNGCTVLPRSFFHIRSSLENRQLEIPQKEEDTLEEVYDELDKLIGPDGYFRFMHEILEEDIRTMEPRTLRLMLSELKTSYSINLQDYGGSHTIIKDNNGVIAFDYSPSKKTETVKRDAIT